MDTAIVGSTPGNDNAERGLGKVGKTNSTQQSGFSANDRPLVKPGLALHPLCELFPRMDGADFEALKADIRANGLHQSIVVYEGQILDGGNRYMACVELGITPAAVEYAGADPLGFVFSANARRRHLTPGQYAAIVASAQNWELAQAAGSNQHTQKAGGQATLHDLPPAAEKAPLQTVADRTAKSGASERTQKMADKVARADPELSRQVAHGEISLPQAVRQVEKKPEPAKVAAPAPIIKPEPDEDPYADLATDAERLVAENRALQERINVLSASDQAAKLNEWITKFHKLDAHLTQVNTTLSEAQKEATRKGKVLAAIRKFLEVERDSEILPKLKGGA